MDISTPVIWYPGQTEAEFEQEIDLMMFRAQATSDMLSGTLDTETFLDILNGQGFDVFDLAENCWTIPLVA